MKESKCPTCNTTINENDSFCYSCGTKIERIKPNVFVIASIDMLCAIIFTILLVFIFYTSYNIYQYPRIVASIVILILCPIIWGTVIYLIVKRKTPGCIIATKIANKKNKDSKTQYELHPLE